MIPLLNISRFSPMKATEDIRATEVINADHVMLTAREVCK